MASKAHRLLPADPGPLAAASSRWPQPTPPLPRPLQQAGAAIPWRPPAPLFWPDVFGGLQTGTQGAAEAATGAARSGAAAAALPPPVPGNAAAGLSVSLFVKAEPENFSTASLPLLSEHPGSGRTCVAHVQLVGSKRSMLSRASEGAEPADKSQERQATKQQRTADLSHPRQQQQQPGTPPAKGSGGKAAATAAGEAGAQAEAAEAQRAAAERPGQNADNRPPRELSLAALQEQGPSEGGAGQQAGSGRPSCPNLKFRVVLGKRAPSLQPNSPSSPPAAPSGMPTVGGPANGSHMAAAKQGKPAYPGEAQAVALEPQPQLQQHLLMPPPPPRPHKAVRRLSTQPADGQTGLAAGWPEQAGSQRAVFPAQERGHHPPLELPAEPVCVLSVPGGPDQAFSMHEAAAPTGKLAAEAVGAAETGAGSRASCAASAAASVADGLSAAARHLAATISLLQEGQQRLCAQKLLHRLGSRVPPRMSLLAVAGWADQQGFALEDTR